MAGIDATAMALVMAKGELDFAIAKCCQAKIAEYFGRDSLREGEMASTLEAVGRAADYLKELLGVPAEKLTGDELEKVATGMVPVADGRKLSDLDSVGPVQSGNLQKFRGQ